MGVAVLMKKKEIYHLASLSTRILTVIMTMIYISVFLVIVALGDPDEIPIWAYLLSGGFSIAGLLIAIIAFKNRIIFDFERKVIVIDEITQRRIPLNMIDYIEVSTENSLDSKRFSIILIFLIDGKKLTTNGYQNVFGRKNDTEVTRKIVDDVNQKLANSSNL